MQPMLPFILFAFVASITPGPTNILALTNASRFGLGAAIHVILGSCVAVSGMVIVIGIGLGATLTGHPLTQSLMSWGGLVWLSYLSWQMFRSAPAELHPETETPAGVPLGGLQAAALQLVNPKAWMMVLAVVGVFTVGHAHRIHLILRLSLVFLLISMPCVGVWAGLGRWAGKLFRSPSAIRGFNQVMAVMLFASAWLSLVV